MNSALPRRHRVLVLCVLLLGAIPGRHAVAQFDRPWEIYLVPFSHIDVGYTAPVDQVVQDHLRYLDTVTAWVGRTQDNDPEERFRWAIEIPWVLDAYISQRTPARVESLMACVRRGDIEIGGMYFGLQSDLCGNEELVRSLIFSQELRNSHNVPIRTAFINDTPGFTWSLAQLLPEAGIPYLSVAMNSFLCDFFTTTTLPNLFYVQAQSGKKVLVWRSIDPSWAYLEGSATCAVYAGGPAIMQTKLTQFLQNLAASGYPYNEVLVNCATGDNGAPNRSIVYNTQEWNAALPGTRAIISTATAFFDTMVSRHGTEIPTFSGDAPNWWTWLFAPSATGGNVLSRKAHTFLPAAETFAALASHTDPAFVIGATTFRDAYINNLTFEDHNLGANYTGGNEPFWLLKMGWINAAVDTGTNILSRATDALAAHIPTGAYPAIAVFNPLAWTRSIPVQLAEAQTWSLGPFDVYAGATGTPVPTQLLHDGAIIFMAEDVPSVGYAVFRIVPKAGSFAPHVPLAAQRLENGAYRIDVDPATGGLLSLFDKTTGHEIVATAGRFNQYSYNGSSPPSGMAVIASDSGSVVQSLTLRGSAQGTTSYTTTVSLYENLKRVDMLNVYDKLSPTTTETVDFNFSFAMSSPHLRYEIPFGTVRLFDDELSGFRVKHYALGNWLGVASTGGDFATLLAVENAAVTAHPTGTFDGNVRIMASYNSTSTAYRAGVGLLPMNFSLTTAAGFAPDSAMRHAYSFAAPAPVRVIPAGQSGSLNPARQSFLQIDPEILFLSTVKEPLAGQGWIVRLFNPLDRTVPAVLRFAGTVMSATETSLLEVDQSSLPIAHDSVMISFGPYQVKTLRVSIAPTTGVDHREDVPLAFGLDQCYPNPFNPTTNIRYSVGELGSRQQAIGNRVVKLAVYDLLGREVAVLVDERKPAGTYTVTFNGENLATGVYVCRLQADAQAATIKLMLIK